MAKTTENTSNDTGKIIGALLIGAAVGGALGILFAPDKGSETRKKILAKGGDLKDSLMEKFSGLMDTNPGANEDEKDLLASQNHSVKS